METVNELLWHYVPTSPRISSIEIVSITAAALPSVVRNDIKEELDAQDWLD